MIVLDSSFKQIMSDIFQLADKPNQELFFKRGDARDVRLGETVSFNKKDYEASDIVILGCPQDEGVARNKGRIGAALAPETIRAQFYKLTNFGAKAKIFDLGNTKIAPTLEETHDTQTEIVSQILRDGKRIIALGGGNDISYADGCAASVVFGAENWLCFNIDAHFDVRADKPRNSGTPYRQLLEEKLLKAENFYEMAYQPQANSPVYFDYLRNLGVRLKSLGELREYPSYKFQNSSIAERFQEIFINRRASKTDAAFWGFDLDAVRAADAPGVSSPSPIGLTAEEFIALAKLAGSKKQTRIIEFTEVNPNFDIDNRTARLVAIAMHAFCSGFVADVA